MIRLRFDTLVYMMFVSSIFLILFIPDGYFVSRALVIFSINLVGQVGHVVFRHMLNNCTPLERTCIITALLILSCSMQIFGNIVVIVRIISVTVKQQAIQLMNQHPLEVCRVFSAIDYLAIMPIFYSTGKASY